MKLASTALALLFAALPLAGCGSSGGGQTQQPISGTILGAPFTPAGAAALVVAPSLCNLGTDASLTGVVLGFASFADVCGFAATSQLCGDKASALVVPVIVARARVATAGAVPPLGPGTYVHAEIPVLDGNGFMSVVEANVIRTLDTSCTHPAVEPELASGTVRLDVLDATRAAGSADLVFTDGSTLAGTFDVPVCAYQADLCGLVTGACSTPACFP
jgi:hypothetical protein